MTNDWQENFISDSGSIATHSIRGEVKKVVFTSDDGTYAVIRLTDSEDNEHTLVGPLAGVYEGQGIEATGNWENHKEHGKQFRVIKFKTVLPNTPEGIAKYLASGIIPGIGPKYAEAIVRHFGAQTLDVLDNYSARLREVPGIGRKKLEMIRKAWQEHEAEREIHIFLQSLGLGHAFSNRILKTYGAQTPVIVRENPYRLAEEVDGIGFITADRIAFNLGIDKKNNARLCAGVAYALNRLSEAGHTCYPESDFIKYVAELLDVEEEFALKGLELAVERKLAVIDPLDFCPEQKIKMVYGTYLYNAEVELSRHTYRLGTAKNPAGRKMLGIRLPPPSIQLNELQLEAVESAMKYPVSILTGGPGVGKTTVVGEIVRRAKFARLKFMLAAPTGRASKRLSESCRCNAMTIHRLLKWDPVRRSFVFCSNYPLNCDIIIVDETSMLDLPLALHLLRALRTGTTVVFVGDADQLPSVGPGNILHDFIACNCFKVTHLTQIYRQAEGSRIISNAHRVNAGEMPDIRPVARENLADFYWIDQDDPEKAAAIISEMFVSRIPKRFGFSPIKDIQVITPMNKGICGTESLNRRLQEAVNPPGDKEHYRPQFSFGETIFRSGDKVMQTANNYDKSVFNGEIGRIVHINHTEKKFIVAYDTADVAYDFSEADQIVHAYAVTVHKSQGCEFPAVIVPIFTQHYVMLQRNLIYTAMTRAKKLLVMIGSRKALAIAVRNYKIEKRYSMLLERIKALVNAK